MNISKMLSKLDAPAEVKEAAHVALSAAVDKSKGLTWHKWKLRLFKAKKLASKLSWESERLIDVDPNLLSSDIAPVINVTAYGDHVVWVEGVGPVPGTWMNKDPNSEDYKSNLAASKEKGYKHDVHSRTKEWHTWWYRRNAGEGEAWIRGAAVGPMPQRPQVWKGENTLLLHSGDAWQLYHFKPWFGKWGLLTEIGHEISNVWNFKYDAQGHYPIPGYELRGPLSCTALPHKRPDILDISV